MIFDFPIFDEFTSKIDELLNIIRSVEAKINPQQEWLTLREAAQQKGVKYNTLKCKRQLQPNHGKEDGHVCGRRVCRRESVLQWLDKTDCDLKSN